MSGWEASEGNESGKSSSAGDMETAAAQETPQKDSSDDNTSVPQWRTDMEALGVKDESSLVDSYKQSQKGMNQAFQQKAEAERVSKDLSAELDVLRSFIKDSDIDNVELREKVDNRMKAVKAEESRLAEKQEADKRSREANARLLKEAEEIMGIKYQGVFTPDNRDTILNLASTSKAETVVGMLEEGVSLFEKIRNQGREKAGGVHREKEAMRKNAGRGSYSPTGKHSSEQKDYWGMDSEEFQKAVKPLYG